jgi:hypothetical protein
MSNGRRVALILLLMVTGFLQSQEMAVETATLQIPRVSRPPKLQDFLTDTPREAEVRVSGFRQFEPGDGTLASRETTAYLSYDDKNLYVVYACQDEPGEVRAHLAKREDVNDDDTVVLNLDTFHDHVHSYRFISNPLGIQLDGIFTEGQGADDTFDTLWYSEGRLTANGFIVWMAIPFKSLRFPRQPVQSWGIALGRSIRRKAEFSTWPYITQRLQSYVQQLATLEGLEGISPGRNLQFIPYFAFSRSRFLDQLAPQGPAFRTDTEVRPGLDTKMVLRDALTLDVALNPDFSQVESDEPQVTVNQRFEVFFPEKRPFFIENASFFQTPSNLFFSRRIADPQFGARLTGKVGRWAIGALGMDDRAQGSLLPESDPLHGDRAAIAAIRIQREFSQQSNVGMLMTTRDFAGSSNRVFSLDTRLKLNPNWVLVGQSMRSQTRQLDGSTLDGSGYWVELSQSGRHAQYAARYLDYSPDFQTQVGFVPRVDIRKMEHFFEYYWKPKNRWVLLFGPDITTSINWNRHDQVQDWVVDASFGANLTGPSGVGCRHVNAYELFQGLGFRQHTTDCGADVQWVKWLAVNLDYGWGTSVNYFPGPGLVPFLADKNSVKAGFSIRPSPRLRFDQSYLYTRLGARSDTSQPQAVHASIFNNHILRSKMNYQISRQLSLRVIVDYNAVLPNPDLVALAPRKRLTGDFLLTYLVNPGTALYVGYTDTHENLRLIPGVPANVMRAGAPDISTGRQFFVKVSYMFRF